MFLGYQTNLNGKIHFYCDLFIDRSQNSAVLFGNQKFEKKIPQRISNFLHIKQTYRFDSKMKFRAHSNNFEAIQNILKSFQAASRLSNSIVFKISTTSIQLITNPSARSHHLLSRCELIRSLLFDEYVLKGFSEQDNFIYFDVRSDTLSQVLHSLQNNLKSLKLKLMNGSKGRFVLSITAEYPTFKADRIIRYQVYIDILNRNIWNSLDEYRLDPINVMSMEIQFSHLINWFFFIQGFINFTSFQTNQFSYRKPLINVSIRYFFKQSYQSI